MAEPKPIWEKTPKPWPRDICRQRFVFGDKITIKELAILAKVPLGTARRWSFSEKVGSKRSPWPEQRDHREQKTNKTVDQKIEEASAIAVSRVVALNDPTEKMIAHLTALEKTREVAVNFVSLYHKIVFAIENGTSISDAEQKAFAFQLKVGGKTPLGTHINALQMAIAGERQVLRMDYDRPEVLMAAAQKMGYLLIDPNMLPEGTPLPEMQLQQAIAPALDAQIMDEPENAD
jgi:hypothetical protein